MMIFLLDTNVISDFMTSHVQAARHIAEHLAAGKTLGLCRPVHYEIRRGLLWRGATAKLKVYTSRVIPLLTWFELMPDDWEQAAQFWADTRRKGKQLGDPDLLLAAITHRLNVTLISSDADFEALPIHRENWRS